jgi:membrane protein DedA with SNARE-associated domain
MQFNGPHRHGQRVTAGEAEQGVEGQDRVRIRSPGLAVKCARRKTEMAPWGRAAVALADLLKLAPPILYAVALLAAFLESAPAVGLLVPGQTILFGAGFLSGQGRLDPFVLAGLVCVGGFSGDTLGFVLGRRWGVGPLERLPGRLRLTAGGRARLTALFASHGAKSVVLARFQPLGRAFGPYLAGATGMPAGRFLAADALASVLAAGSLVALGYLAGVGFERLSRTLGLTAVVVVSVLLVLVVAAGLRIKHKKEHLQDDLVGTP